MVGAARSFIGSKYVWGGESRGGTDCSGMVCAIAKEAGIALPRMTAHDMFASRSLITLGPKDTLQAGDLLFFRTSNSSRITHVAVYTGRGTIIHASSGRGRVVEDKVSDYWAQRYAGAKRIRK